MVAASGWAGVRRTVRHIAAQSEAHRIELVLVAQSREVLGEIPPSDVAGLGSVRRVDVGPIPDVERALVPGVRAATAPVVALIEDHAFPEPDWARWVLEAHRGPWAGVGPALLNANPGSALSWANMLLAYGRWPETGRGGETRDIPRHNSSFRRDVLLAYGARLETMLARAGDLLPSLLADGHRLYFEPRARVRHVNPSRLDSTLALRIGAGRLYAATRADAGRWRLTRRLAYVAGAPLIPAARLVRQRRELLAGRTGWAAAKLVPVVGLGLTLDAVGQMVGYAVGAGTTREALASFEMDRSRHITERDRRAVAEA